MIPSFIFLFLSYLSIVGYSIFLKKILFINKKNNLDFYNLDFIYGISLIILLGCLINFFFPLKLFSIYIIIFGLFLFFFYYNKINFKFNIKIIFALFFFFLFISASHNQVGDSTWYHLQNIKWINDFKISFGLANLEPRYGYNSLFYIFLSAFNIAIENLQTKYILSILFYSVFFCEAFFFKLNDVSKIFIFFTKVFLLAFSLIHPDVNGVLFNYIGSIEIDNIIFFFYLISIYLFLKIIHGTQKKNDVYLLVLVIVLSITFKITALPLIVFLFYIFYKKLLPNKLKLLLLLIFIFWLLRGFIQSGCFIFPIAQTCFDVFWSIKLKDLDDFVNMAKSFPRSAPSRIMAGDFNYTLYSFLWVKNWLNDYFLKASMIRILIVIFFSSLIALPIFSVLDKNYYRNFICSLKKNIVVFLVLLLSIIFWLQSPEIRYANGQLLSLILLFLLLVYFPYIKKTAEFLKISKLVNKFIFTLMTLIIIKNYPNFSYLKKYYTLEKNYDYSSFKLLNINNSDIYYNPVNNFCYDFKKICILDQSKNYFFTINKGYFFFNNL